MTRRTFTTLASFGLVETLTGMNHFSPVPSKTITVHEEVLWNLLGRFAFSVGASVVSSLVYDYIKENWVKDELKTIVRNANTKLVQDGFTNFRESKVVQTSAGEVMYAAISNSTTPNICVPIINARSNSRLPVTMLEGPSIAALAVAAEATPSKLIAANYLMPIKEITSAVGGWQDGYTRPTVYISRAGTVKIDYRSRNNGSGVAQIGVTHNNDVLFLKDIDINYVV